jgi:hypothetical protein
MHGATIKIVTIDSVVLLFLSHSDPFPPTCTCRGVVVEFDHTQ